MVVLSNHHHFYSVVLECTYVPCQVEYYPSLCCIPTCNAVSICEVESHVITHITGTSPVVPLLCCSQLRPADMWCIIVLLRNNALLPLIMIIEVCLQTS